MKDFPIHTVQSAPDASKCFLNSLQEAFGLIPNIAGAMATSPVLLGSLVDVFQRVHSGSFSEQQIQVVLLTNAVTNACEWAVAFHTCLARQQGVSDLDVKAIRDHHSPQDSKLTALSTLARTLIEKRGRLNRHDVEQFLGAGFERAHVLEVVAIVAASTMTNYAGNITQPPLESAFQAFAWSVKERS